MRLLLVLRRDPLLDEILGQEVAKECLVGGNRVVRAPSCCCRRSHAIVALDFMLSLSLQIATLLHLDHQLF